MQFKANAFAQQQGLQATFEGEISEPEDVSVGIYGSHGYFITNQIEGSSEAGSSAALLIELQEAIYTAFVFHEDSNYDLSISLSDDWDELMEMLFSEPDRDPADVHEDYEAENTDFGIYWIDWENETPLMFM